MRPLPRLVAALSLLPGSIAVDQKKSVILSFPNDTPNSVVEKFKKDLVSAGGVITHEYSLIKAFAVDAPEKALQMVQGQGTEHGMLVEEDQVVSIQG